MPGIFHLVCSGKLYPEYVTFDHLFAGLARLLANAPVPELRVTYYGRSCDEVRRAAAAHGVEGRLDCSGFVSPVELRSALAGADVLVAQMNQRGDAGSPGGKLYEYLAARRPVLAVPGGDPYVTDVLERTAAGRSATSPDEVAGVLREWLGLWRARGTVAYEGRPDAIERYSMRTKASELATVLDRLYRHGLAIDGRSA